MAKKGKGKDKLSRDIACAVNAGYPQKQAVAIAYSKQRKGKSGKKSKGKKSGK